MSTEPPPKTPTPRPSQEIATVGDVQKAAAEEKKSTVITTVGGVLAIMATMIGAYFGVITKAQAAGSENARQVAKDLKSHEDYGREVRAEIEGRFERIERGLDRHDRKLDAVLMRWGIPNPAPGPVP